ncbi:MAG: enolase C-terminal domain-like protein [Elusimicrobiota bacterium]|nr:enolase C-terminal domain-like protein [Elusimicrobiota bacterium]
MPPFVIASFRAAAFETPLKRPFVTAQGRKESTVNVGLTLRLTGGAEGYGEASSSIALKHLTPAALERALRRLAAASRGRDARAWRALVDEAWRSHGELSPAVAAFECALLSALAAQSGASLRDWFGGARRQLESDLTLSAWTDPEVTRRAAAEAASEGFRVLKVKVGGRFDDDLARLRAARRGAPRARLLLDGNQGLTRSGALKLVEAALKLGPVDLLEQPLPKRDLAGMAFVAARCPVPVAADESVATPEDALRVLGMGAATAINVKVAKSGLSRSLAIAAVARAAGAPLMIGCMAETARGLAASAALAAGTGFFRFVDLDSDHLLAESAAARRAAGWTRRGARLLF